MEQTQEFLDETRNPSIVDIGTFMERLVEFLPVVADVEQQLVVLERKRTAATMTEDHPATVAGLESIRQKFGAGIRHSRELHELVDRFNQVLREIGNELNGEMSTIYDENGEEEKRERRGGLRRAAEGAGYDAWPGR